MPDAARLRTRELALPATVLRRLAAEKPDRYPMLLDSAASGALGEHSILCGPPTASLWRSAAGIVTRSGRVPAGTGFLDTLETWWRETPALAPSGLPFCGGWMLFLGYELAAEVEPRLELPAGSFPFSACALRVPSALLSTGAAGSLLAVAEADDAQVADRWLADIEVDARAAAAAGPLAPATDAAGRRFETHEEDPARYLEQVRRAQEHVRAGDVYQANLARRWQVRFEQEPDVATLYERLRAANPAPFAALAQFGPARILSSSPERLVRIDGDRVDTRPIAGTRPRGEGLPDDLAYRTELASHPKERAEHVMLIDLERNDLGRVCTAGSVRVDEFMTIESYAHVHHIVSNVSGRLRPGVSPIGAVRAVFPGGTITGCPKFRCMQIIAALEGRGRGPYTGSLGYLSRDGRLDLNILIRTLSVQGREAELYAGAGIVADSIPERELEETRAKARGLLRALETYA